MNGSGKERPASPVEEEAQAWFARLRAGHTVDQAAFEDWFATSPAHADAYERLLSTWDTTAPLSTAQVDDNDAWSAGFARRRGLWAFAAAVAVLVIGAGWILMQGSRPRPLAQLATIASQEGQSRRISLADGSRLMLQPDSALVPSFSASERRLRLAHGNVRFAVAPESNRPFVVETNAGTITAIGTEFDVAVDGTQTTVRLLRGSLAIRCLATSGDAPIRLTAGQRLTFSASGPVVGSQQFSAASVHPSEEMVSFENERLAQVLSTINRTAPIKILLEDAVSGELRFTGSLRPAEPIYVARLLAATFRLRVRHSTPETVSLAR